MDTCYNFNNINTQVSVRNLNFDSSTSTEYNP